MPPFARAAVRSAAAVKRGAEVKLDAGFHKPAKEMQVTRQAIKFGNHQGCIVQPAHSESASQLRAIGILARFHLGELFEQRPSAAVQIISHGIALRFQAQARGALLGG